MSDLIKVLKSLSKAVRISLPAHRMLAQDDEWITVKPNGAGKKGAPVLLGPGGEIKGGMGGKFTGKNISQAKSKPSAALTKKSTSKKQASTPSGTTNPKAIAPSTPSKPKKETPKQAEARNAAEMQTRHSASSVEMSPREVEAMKNYSGAMYQDLNSRLRKGKGASKGDAEDLKQMDKVFERASTKEPINVYRGVSPEMVAKLKPGATFTDGGFSSTTASRDIAEGYSSFGGPGGAVMEIKVPKGSKAVSLKDTSSFGGSSSSTRSEEEILLNRGGKFKVVEVIQDPPKWVKGRFGTNKVTPPPRIVVELEQ